MHLGRLALFQGTGARCKRRASGEDVVDQQDTRAFDATEPTAAGRECTTHIEMTLTRRAGSLAWRGARALQRIVADRFSRLAGQGCGEPARLVVAACREPPVVQWNRDNQVGLVKQVLPG